MPIKDGELQVYGAKATQESKNERTRTIVSENGSSILLSKTYNVEDGKIVRLETTTLLDETTATTRARVTQLFGSGRSSLAAVTVFNCVESRVDRNDEMVPSGYPPEFNL